MAALFYSCASYYPPAFFAVDDIYVSPPDSDQSEAIKLDLSADCELDCSKTQNMFTAMPMYSLSAQAGGGCGITHRVSDSSAYKLNLEAGLLGCVVDDLKNDESEFALFNEGFLWSAGFFGQADIMLSIKNRNVYYVPGILYAVSYEAAGSYPDYRRTNSEIELGALTGVCSQALVYLDISKYGDDEIRYFFRPFIGSSNMASFNPMLVPEGLTDYLNAGGNDIEAYGLLWMIYPDLGLYLGYEDERSYYCKIRVSELLSFSVSMGIGF